jgi:hypothetical protein
MHEGMQSLQAVHADASALSCLQLGAATALNLNVACMFAIGCKCMYIYTVLQMQ